MAKGVLRIAISLAWMLAAPVSPAQTPIQNVATELAQAASFLREHGIPDPKGCQFVSARVWQYDAFWGRKQLASIPGWLLPGGHTILALDGLVFAVEKLNGGADLEKVVGALDQTPGSRVELKAPAAAMLILAGQPDLAKTVYGELKATHGADPAFRVFDAYLTSRFVRAMAEHAAGDDEGALADGVYLTDNRSAFTEEARRLAEKNSPAPRASATSDAPFRYLDAVSSLVADSKRRIERGPRPLLDLNALDKVSKSRRIQLLIENLDEVGTSAQIIPNFVLPNESNYLEALVAQGDAAVEPLLDVIGSDKRFARSISISRNWFPSRNLIPVSALAWTAFLQIVQVDSFGPRQHPVQMEDLRKFWAQNKRLTPPQRWMRILADDSMGSTAWEAAANRIVAPTSVTIVGPVTIGSATKDAPMKGEPLRKMRDPSVTDLMVKRAKQLQSMPDDSGGDWHYHSSLAMAMKVAKWQPAEALPVLQSTTRAVMDDVRAKKTFLVMAHNDVAFIRAIDRRIELGDREALAEYAAWLMETRQDNAVFGAMSLAPLVKYRTDPGMREIAPKLFQSADSCWNPANEAKWMVDGRMTALVASPLLSLPEFVESVLRSLCDTSLVSESGQTRICDAVAQGLSGLKGAPAFAMSEPLAERDESIAAITAFVKGRRDHLLEFLPENGWRQEWFGDRP